MWRKGRTKGVKSRREQGEEEVKIYKGYKKREKKNSDI
jgi:hypothetical protein